MIILFMMSEVFFATWKRSGKLFHGLTCNCIAFMENRKLGKVFCWKYQSRKVIIVVRISWFKIGKLPLKLETSDRGWKFFAKIFLMLFATFKFQTHFWFSKYEFPIFLVIPTPLSNYVYAISSAQQSDRWISSLEDHSFIALFDRRRLILGKTRLSKGFTICMFIESVSFLIWKKLFSAQTEIEYSCTERP